MISTQVTDRGLLAGSHAGRLLGLGRVGVAFRLGFRRCLLDDLALALLSSGLVEGDVGGARRAVRHGRGLLLRGLRGLRRGLRRRRRRSRRLAHDRLRGGGLRLAQRGELALELRAAGGGTRGLCSRGGRLGDGVLGEDIDGRGGDAGERDAGRERAELLAEGLCVRGVTATTSRLWRASPRQRADAVTGTASRRWRRAAGNLNQIDAAARFLLHLGSTGLGLRRQAAGQRHQERGAERPHGCDGSGRPKKSR